MEPTPLNTEARSFFRTVKRAESRKRPTENARSRTTNRAQAAVQTELEPAPEIVPPQRFFEFRMRGSARLGRLCGDLRGWTGSVRHHDPDRERPHRGGEAKRGAQARPALPRRET